MENQKRIRNRSVGRREKPITLEASGEALIRGAMFNDEMHKMFGVKHNGVPKGVYHFKNHAEANEHMESCIAKKMAKKMASKP